jgi:hypothetical protein
MIKIVAPLLATYDKQSAQNHCQGIWYNFKEKFMVTIHMGDQRNK